MRVSEPLTKSSEMRAARYWLSGMLLSLTAALILSGIVGLPLLITWLIAINVFSLLYYGIDKLNAVWADEIEARVARKVRIPETSLLLLALGGGSLGAGLAMGILNHKLAKSWFITGYLLILGIQMLAVILLWDRLPWS